MCRKNARLGSLGTWSAHCYDNLIRSGTIYPDKVFTRRRWPIVSVSSSKVSTFLSSSYRLQKLADTDRPRVNKRPIRKDFFPERYDFVPIIFISSSCKRGLSRIQTLFTTDRDLWLSRKSIRPVSERSPVRIPAGLLVTFPFSNFSLFSLFLSKKNCQTVHGVCTIGGEMSATVKVLIDQSDSNSIHHGERYHTQHPMLEDANEKDRQPSITFEVLSQHRDILHLHIEEAMAIQSLRPPLNHRDEHLGTGFLVWSPFSSISQKKSMSLHQPFFTHSFHQQIHARTSFTHLTRQIANTTWTSFFLSLPDSVHDKLFFFSFLYNRKIPVQCPVDELKML